MGKEQKSVFYSVIEEGVQIGRNCRISHHVVIHGRHVIATRCASMLSRSSANGPCGQKDRFSRPGARSARIGSHCDDRRQAVIYRGCTLDEHVLIADGGLPCASRSPSAPIPSSGRNATVENLTTIGRKCKLETNCYITAYSTIEDFCFIAPGVHTTNDNFMGRNPGSASTFQGCDRAPRRADRRSQRYFAGKEIGAMPWLQPIGGDPRCTAAHRGGGIAAHPLRAVPDEQLLENQGWKNENRDDRGRRPGRNSSRPLRFQNCFADRPGKFSSIPASTRTPICRTLFCRTRIPERTLISVSAQGCTASRPAACSSLWKTFTRA
jgi:acyl-[acyl carrier protein]--UDP-N-acetylglucosamine O-acyltransferase